MKLYITTTFSPMMIGPELSRVKVLEIKDFEMEFAGISSMLGFGYEVVPAVGHDVTAKVLEPIIERYLPGIADQVFFNRTNISLSLYDHVLAIIPNFRASESREFTAKEVLAAGFRAFLVTPELEPTLDWVDDRLKEFRESR